MLLYLEIDCRMPILVTCDRELLGVITPEEGRQTVEVSCEEGQQIFLYSDMPYLLYSADEEDDEE